MAPKKTYQQGLLLLPIMKAIFEKITRHGQQTCTTQSRTLSTSPTMTDTRQ